MKNSLHQVKYTSGISTVGTQQKHRDQQSRTAESPEEKQAHRGHSLSTHLHLSIQGNTWCTNSPFATSAGQATLLPFLKNCWIFLNFPSFCPSHRNLFVSCTSTNGLLQQQWCLASWTLDDAHPDAVPGLQITLQLDGTQGIFTVPFSGKEIQFNTDQDLK